MSNAQRAVPLVPVLKDNSVEGIEQWIDAVSGIIAGLSDQVSTLARVAPEYQVYKGSGTPEASVYAPVGAVYFNTSGASGTLEYRKVLADIGGDTTKGWTAV